MFAAIAVMIAFSVTNAAALTVVNGDTLTASTYTSTTSNVLSLSPSGTTGFNFSGITGSFATPASGTFSSSSSSASSTNGFYYADYLINVAGSTAESVTTSLTNPSGVTKLSERIYTYNSNANNSIHGFLGDTKFSDAGITGIQAWSSNYPLPGVNVSIVSSTPLTAGNYVVELRGMTAGNFGGTLSLTPAIPEPSEWLLMLICFGVAGILAARRKNNSTNIPMAA